MRLHHEKIPSDFNLSIRWIGILGALIAVLIGLAELAIRIN